MFSTASFSLNPSNRWKEQQLALANLVKLETSDLGLKRLFSLYSNISRTGKEKLAQPKFDTFLKENGLRDKRPEYNILFSEKGKRYVEFDLFVELIIQISIREHPKLGMTEAVNKLKQQIIPMSLEEDKEEETTTSEWTSEPSFSNEWKEKELWR